jgi:hypothetical protein
VSNGEIRARNITKGSICIGQRGEGHDMERGTGKVKDEQVEHVT